MPVRADGDRLDAIESVLVQLLAETFGSQLVPLRALQSFADRVQDLSGRSAALESFIAQVDRRRQHIEKNRKIR